MVVGVGSQILKKLEMVATDAKTVAAGASTCSTTASNLADKVVKSFKQLFQKNPSLKK